MWLVTNIVTFYWKTEKKYSSMQMNGTAESLNMSLNFCYILFPIQAIDYFVGLTDDASCLQKFVYSSNF